MKKIEVLIASDILAGLSFYLLLLTGLMLEFLFPKGAGNKVKIWDLGRHDWGELHLIIGYVFIALIVFHLILHWRWIAEVLIRKVNRDNSKKQSILIWTVILILLLSPAILFI